MSEAEQRRCRVGSVPPGIGALSIPTPPDNWRQYVAVYSWPEGDETIGFCNWIRHDEAYLEGGMCVRESAYRRLPREDFRAIREQGGIAHMMMSHAATELTDCKAMVVDLRFGYERTRHPHLIVKWFADVPVAERERLIESIAAIGPF